MWILTVNSPWSEPREYTLKAGKTTLGRHPGNDIVISDESASRLHAEIEFDVAGNAVSVRDLGSTNGTYLSHERLIEVRRLRPGDELRIGQHRLALTFRDPSALGPTAPLTGTQPVTRDLLLQAVDQHALVLYEVTSRLNTILDLDMALNEVGRLAQAALGAEQCVVLPVNRFDQLDHLAIPSNYIRQAIEQRAILARPDLAAEPGHAPPEVDDDDGPPVRALLCVPGTINNEVLALLYAYRRGDTPRPFEQHAVNLAVGISHQAALTVQRTQLLERARQMEQLAIVDELTGLYNRRRFFEQSQFEFHRAQRYQRPLSVLMLDVAGLKQTNGRYGHAAGDEVLRAVARACKRSLRESQFVGRYGGDEFVVLLPECDPSAAQKVAERLRAHVSKLAVAFDSQTGALRPRIDIGAATLTPEIPDLPALVQKAEAELAEIKRAAL
jgi:diguanylate cyclase (GGDEF)-like protein